MRKKFIKIGSAILTGVLVAGTVVSSIPKNVAAESLSTGIGDIGIGGTSDSTEKPYTLSYNLEQLENGEPCSLTFTISENAAGDVTIDLAGAVITVLQDYIDTYYSSSYSSYPVQPGDSNLFNITIVNNSPYMYQYEEGSLTVGSADVSGYSEEELSPFTAKDGSRIPYKMLAAITLTSKAIYNGLYGYSSSSRITVDNLFAIYEVLETKGYTGDSALSDYMRDYYKSIYSDASNYPEIAEKVSAAATFAEICEIVPAVEKEMANKGTNGISSVSLTKIDELCAKYPELSDFVMLTGVNQTTKKAKVQLKAPESDLAVTLNSVFYDSLFAIDFKAELSELAELNPNYGSKEPEVKEYFLSHGIYDYLDTTSETYKTTDSFLSSLGTIDNSENINFAYKTSINGPLTGNAYQNYSFSYQNTLILKPVYTAYTIVNEYYTSIDGADYALDGTYADETLIPVAVGTVITADELTEITAYNGIEYSFDADNSDASIVAALEDADNVITLRYYRDYTTPTEEPTTEEPITEEPTTEEPTTEESTTEEPTTEEPTTEEPTTEEVSTEAPTIAPEVEADEETTAVTETETPVETEITVEAETDEIPTTPETTTAIRGGEVEADVDTGDMAKAFGFGFAALISGCITVILFKKK